MTRWAAHPITLRQLQYVVAIADTLSFRKAADACNVSQPSLSAQVAQVEKILGIDLFERRNRRVVVLETARSLIERARVVLREADDLATAAHSAGDPRTGDRRIGVIPTISPYLLPAIARPLRVAYPKIRFIWIEDRTDTLLRSLRSGSLDAALLAIEADVGDVDRAVIARDSFLLATSPSDKLGAGKAPVRQAELRGESRVLLLEDGH
jgi:LysR family hydrogen peroxide-inducible transcriptional activator